MWSLLVINPIYPARIFLICSSLKRINQPKASLLAEPINLSEL